MESLKIRVKKVSPRIGKELPLPSYATPGSAGMDLRACLEEPVTIMPGKRAKIPTGIAIQIPHPGIVGLVCARSGNAWKHGVTLSNAVGVIDSDYTGEIQVLISNLDPQEPFTIHDGDRIAQILFVPVYQATLVEVEELEETLRGAGGFGSTGKA